MVNILQSSVAKLNTPVNYPSCAGEVVVNRFLYSAPAAGVPTGDIVELGVLPPNCRVIDAILISDALGTAAKFDVGIMSGAVNSTDPARTCGAELWAAADVAAATVLRLALQTGFELAPSDKERSIGLKSNPVASAPTAGVIELRLFIAQA